MRDDYAIIVGIKDYPEFKPLQGPVNDAQRFYNWVIASDGGQVPAAHATLIISTQDPPALAADLARPTQEIFVEAITPLVDTAFKSRLHRVGRRLYLYFAGHGMLPTRAASPDFDDAALLMANASQRFLGRHIPGHPYADWFRTAGAFDEIILLMDCCREDLPNVNPSYPSMTELKGNMDAVKYLYGVAARFGQDARETLLGNPPESRGLFSFAVMETLQSGPRDANGELTASILAGSVMKRVRELSDPANPQDPKFILNDFTITAGASPRIDVRVQFAPGAIGEQIELLDGTLKVMAPPSPITASAAPVSLKLQPGIYGLRRAGQNSPSQTFPVSPDRNPIDVTFT